MRCDHEALKRDEAAWASLRLVGVQRFEGEPAIELRDCPCCKSTLAREVVEPAQVAA